MAKQQTSRLFTFAPARSRNGDGLATLGVLKMACILIVFCAAMAIASPAQIFKTLVNFDGSNGAYPNSIVQARDGKLWGTTFGIGLTYCGTAFKMSRTGVLAMALAFDCDRNFSDGDEPQGLIQATDGNFYGVTFFGGANNEGTVFKLTPEGVLTTLATFNGTNGSGPVGTLTEGKDGNLYGATYSGGDTNSWGTVFKVTRDGTLSTLYQFDFTHGAQPYAGVVQGIDGSFYGTTYGGGAYGVGTVYKITSQGAFTVVYSFGEHTFDPDFPVTPLVQGRDGNFYGTTPYGGNSSNSGAIFEVTPGGLFTTLYAFSGPDGYSPGGPLVQATDGDFYGTAAYNTNGGKGTVFKITSTGTLTTLHTFNGTDGAGPSGLVQDTNGTFFGLTAGGTSNDGTAFSLNTGLGPFVSFVPPLSSGKVGKTIQILGQGFTSSTRVYFNGTPATPNVKSGTYLTAAVPSGATTGFVTVTTSKDKLTSNKKFRVVK